MTDVEADAAAAEAIADAATSEAAVQGSPVLEPEDAPSAESSNEAEEIFREACEAELERAELLRVQLEAALIEKLGLQETGSGTRISVADVDVPEADRKTSWRKAYEVAKQRTATLEEQLQKARGIGAPPPAAPPAPAATTATPATSIGRSVADAPPGLDDEMEDMKRIQEVTDLAEEEEAVLTLMAKAVLPNGFALLSDSPLQDGQQEGSLPTLPRAREIIGGEDFSITGTIAFERCYVFKGSVPPSRGSGPALEAMRQRLRESSPDASGVELFLQPAKEEGRSFLLMLLDADLPTGEVAWWQWLLCAVLLVISLLAVSSTTFSVVPVAQKLMGEPDALVQVFLKCVPTAAGILATVGAQEAARRAAAARYGVELTPPYLLPAWPIPSVGILGAVTRRLSPAPNWEAEVAMSASAGLAGYLVAFATIAYGLTLGPEPDSVVNLNYQLLPVILKAALRPLLGASSVSSQPDPFADPINIAFPANPVLVGGVVGLIITSLSLLPIGRLDGGVLARAVFGGRNALPLGLLGFSLLLLGSFAPDDSGSLYFTFGACTLIWQNGAELPPLEAVSSVGGGQKALCGVLLVLGFLLCVPGWAFPTI